MGIPQRCNLLRTQTGARKEIPEMLDENAQQCSRKITLSGSTIARLDGAGGWQLTKTLKKNVVISRKKNKNKRNKKINEEKIDRCSPVYWTSQLYYTQSP